MDESLEVFGETIRRQVEAVGKEFTKPDDDWISVLFFENEEGIVVAALDGGLFLNDMTKDGLVGILRVILREEKATRWALLLNAWMVRQKGSKDNFEAFDDEWHGHYHEHPERIEVLNLLIVDREQKQYWMTEIARSDDAPPTLGEWTKLDNAEGRFMHLADIFQGEAA